jgi:radical SAM superfamily enzyme YgiQ (UPF0313 family)
MKRILLIAPEFVQNYVVAPELRKSMPNLPLLQAEAFTTPLHLATIAALTPDDVEVDLWDETIHGLIDEETEFDQKYNLVGITTRTLTLPRAKEIAYLFRQQGIPVAVGGAGVSVAPEDCRDDFDILFIGEAELTWPQFIKDWKAGIQRQEYRQITFPDMSLSPPPRWDSIADKMPYYIVGGVQTSHGCPFDCEFCGIPALFGNRMRHKPVDRVLEEVAMLQRLGMDSIYFYDSNFIGNPSYAKTLLRELVILNNSFEQPMRFQGEFSITMARDDEILALLADANFGMLLVGIESTNEESLRETNKLQNLRRNLIEDCRKVMSYGLEVCGAMIAGFDHDTPEVFDRHFQFIQDAYIPVPVVNLLKAWHGTNLTSRLLKEGRLLDIDKIIYDEKSFLKRDNRGATNIIPKQMTRFELFTGYLDLLERIHDWDNFAVRVKAFISNIKRQPNIKPEKEPEGGLPPSLNNFLLSLDEKARSTIFSIFLHTRQHAPFMMHKVAGIIGRQYLQVSKLPLLREAITKQIEFEESVDIEKFIKKPDLAEVSVSESFKEAYFEIFSDIYEKVHNSLTDANRTYEALIAVFTDFIGRVGNTFNTFSEHHKKSLHEVANCVIAKKNSTSRNLTSVFVNGALDIPKEEAAVRVLKAVEQELQMRKNAER